MAIILPLTEPQPSTKKGRQKKHFDKENIPNNQRANKTEKKRERVAVYWMVPEVYVERSLRTHEKTREEKSKWARGFLMLILGEWATKKGEAELGKSVLFVV